MIRRLTGRALSEEDAAFPPVSARQVMLRMLNHLRVV